MKVSVLIPVYNKAHCVKRCIESIVKQTYRDLEILVYDDGSTDDSIRVVRAIKDRRIRLLVGKHNAGISYARNTLMEAATGKMSAWQDADDYSNPWRIETQLAACKACGVVTSRVYRKWMSAVSKGLGTNPAPPPVSVSCNRGTFCSQLFPSSPIIPFHLGLQLNHELLWEKEHGKMYGHNVVVRAAYYYYNDEEQPYRTMDAAHPCNNTLFYWHKRKLWGNTLRVFAAKLEKQGYLSCTEPSTMTADDIPEYTGDIELDREAVEAFRKLMKTSNYQPSQKTAP